VGSRSLCSEIWLRATPALECGSSGDRLPTAVNAAKGASGEARKAVAAATALQGASRKFRQ